ncbi:MAG: MnmA/TRMU family protein, partial [Myxococcales bacterium]
QLLRAVDDTKDQTYFLFGLTQQQLARTMFPLGELTKPAVRELAASMDLAVASKGDSQEICFVPNGDYAAFMEAYLKETGVPVEKTRGEIVDTEGRRLGEHEGVHRFTVGQRKGLGIPRRLPLYVAALDATSQRVVVGTRDEASRSIFRAHAARWVSEPPRTGATCEVQIRHRGKPLAAEIEPLPGGDVSVRLREPALGIAPGQSAVFYRGDEVLGGARIAR